MKKNIIYILLLVIFGSVIFVPQVRHLFFPIAEIENAVKLNDDDYNIALKGINTQNANLKDFKGNKVLFLNFWGTWCAPCRKEWPSVEQLYRSRKNQMDFVLIAMMDEEQKVRDFIKENNYTAPVYMVESPIDGKILPKVYPTTFILDKNGTILKKETSSLDWFSDNILRFIDEATK